MKRVVVARQDNLGDVLLAGPAIRAVAARAEHVTLLAGPHGAAAGELLPGVDEVQVFRAPWIDPEPPPLTRPSIDALADQLTGFDAAFVFTSFHQSPLPLALVLRLAGVPWIGAICDDYPGSLLDLRHRVPGDPPEALRMLSLARAAGCSLPPGDDGRLAIRGPLPEVSALTGIGDYVVVHPAASVPARSPSSVHSGRMVDALVQAGHRVVVTGAKPEGSTADVDLSGRTTLLELAAVLAWPPRPSSPRTPAQRTWRRRSEPRWCRCSRRWFPPRAGLRSGSRRHCSATSTRRAGEAAPGPVRSPGTRAWTASTRPKWWPRWRNWPSGRAAGRPLEPQGKERTWWTQHRCPRRPTDRARPS